MNEIVLNDSANEWRTLSGVKCVCYVYVEYMLINTKERQSEPTCNMFLESADEVL